MPNPRVRPDFFQTLAVEYLESEAEAGFEFVPPLAQHGGRAGDNVGLSMRQGNRSPLALNPA